MALNVYAKLRGIVGNLFQVGVGGPNLKNVSGVLAARDAADAVDAVVSGATPTAANHLATKAYVDTVKLVDVLRGVRSTQQSSALPLAVGYFEWDIALAYGESATGTVLAKAILETSLAGDTITFDVWKVTGGGGPTLLGTSTATASTSPTTVSLDLTSVFKTGGTAVAAIYMIRIYLTTNDGSTWGTCRGAWIEITP